MSTIFDSLSKNIFVKKKEEEKKETLTTIKIRPSVANKDNKHKESAVFALE